MPPTHFSADPSIQSLHWWRARNLGDELAPYLFEALTGTVLPYQQRLTAKTLITVGSMLYRHTCAAGALFWGTGTLHTRVFCRTTPDRSLLFTRPWRYVRLNIKEQLREKKLPKTRILAVRGPETKRLCDEAGVPCPAVYGDPGVLMPRFYAPKVVVSRYRLGLILHHTQPLGVARERLIDAGILPISIEREGEREIEAFIDELASCERIASTSLHGVILAQSYGIPAQWLRIPGCPIHADEAHKFIDYFRGANQIVQEVAEWSNTEADYKHLLDLTPPDPNPVDAVAERLLETFPHN